MVTLLAATSVIGVVRPSRLRNMLPLTQAINETIAWAVPRLDLADLRWSLRSSELRPDVDFYEPSNPGFFNQSSYIRQVAKKRSALLASKTIDSDFYGELLSVDYEITNHNEATELETDGFFDWADNPPWDLWIGEYNGQLLVWIPPELHDVVERGNAVECMGMFQWVGLNDLNSDTNVA
jgi:hypothetical protein